MRIRDILPRGTDKSVPYVMIISAYLRGGTRVVPANKSPFSIYLFRSSQNATALAAATFRESTLWLMGIFTV